MKWIFTAALALVALLCGPLWAAEAVVFEAIPGAEPDQEDASPFRIEVKGEHGISYSQTTHLMPGCDSLPAVASVTFDGIQGHLLCGTWGGRPGIAMVIAQPHGEWAQSSLFSGEIHPVRYDLPAGQYFLTDDMTVRPWGFGEHFQVYRLSATPGAFGFVPSGDQSARKIYTETLKGYLDGLVTYSEARRLGPALDLLADVDLAPDDRCAALGTLDGRMEQDARSTLGPLIVSARAQYQCH